MAARRRRATQQLLSPSEAARGRQAQPQPQADSQEVVAVVAPDEIVVLDGPLEPLVLVLAEPASLAQPM